MLKSVLFLTLAASATLATVANAEVFKCEGANGKIQFSDTACATGNRSQAIPDRAPISAQQQQDAQQKNQRLQDLAAEPAGEKVAAQASQSPTQNPATNDSDAAANSVSNCVRDVERRGASQNVKAELIAACQSAGQNQRAKNLTADTVSDCVRNIERMGASEKDKARQIAVCHGGDVKPEPVVYVKDRNKLK